MAIHRFEDGGFWTVIPEFALAGLQMGMRVYDELAGSVIFIGIEAGGSFTPLGTAFLCGITHDGYVYPFLVTAQHVINQITQGFISVRLNRKVGGVETLKIPKGMVTTHTDEKNDVAIISVPNLFDIYDVLMWRLDREREKAVRKTWNPAPGDEVHTVGLYTSHYGIARNVPVVRVGHIAMVPGEPVRTGNGYVEAYLVETKSIAGLSGSPVHLQIPRIRFSDDDNQFQILDKPVSILLGVMIGYHVVESAEDQIIVPQQQSSSFVATGGITAENNTGFAVVVPMDRIFEIMETDSMKQRLTASLADHLAQSGFRPASALVAKEATIVAEPDNPSHKEDFTRLLDAATKANKPVS